MKQTRFCSRPVQVRQLADGRRAIRGYAAVFYNGDPATEFRYAEGYAERIQPGAFDRSLSQGDDIVALFDHEGLPLGRRSAGSLDLGVDSVGLWYEARPTDTSRSRDVLAVLDSGEVRGSSFRMADIQRRNTIDGDWNVTEITNVTLLDVGPVSIPAYPGTTAEARSLWSGADVQRQRLAAAIRELELDDIRYS